MPTFLGVPAARRGDGADVVVVGRGPAADAIRTADHLPLDGSRPHLALGVDPLRDLLVVDAGDSPVDGFGEAIVVVLDGAHDVGAGTALVQFSARPIARAGALRLVHVGVRGYGSVPAGDRVYEMAELAARHLHPCLDEAFALLCESCDRVVLSVDLDVVDPGMAPGTAAPEPGGLTSRQLLDAVRRAALELPLVGVDVRGLVPDRDGPGLPTARLANRVVLEALAGICRRRQEQEQTAE